jgi:acyl-CoA reductase-like NAD-dependent aldehyde dehydrogenase
MKGDETLAAIAAAHAVFHSWSRMTAKERGAILRRWVGQQGAFGGVAQVTSVTWC